MKNPPSRKDATAGSGDDGWALVGHRARNALAKVSAHDQGEVKADFWAVFGLFAVE